MEASGGQGTAQPRRRRRRGRGCGCLSGLFILTVTLGLIVVLNPGFSLTDVRGLAERIYDRITGQSEQISTDVVEGQPGSGGEGYTFAQTQADGVTPVTWVCDATIPVEVNPQGAPSGYRAVLDSAIARINDASGFTFQIVGETDDRQFSSRSPGPVLLGYADDQELDVLAGQTVGVGGAVYVQRPGSPAQYVGGMVALDSEVFNTPIPREGTEAIVIHELAHVLGLGHTDTPGELMGTTIATQTGPGPGDRAGLAHLDDVACG